MKKEPSRCHWAGPDPVCIAYHDTEWGVPLWDDLALFELLNLEGAQAGLSWITILKRREQYRSAFSSFNPEKMACFTEKKQLELMKDVGIIRNRLKIAAFIQNAKSFLALQEKGIHFSDFLWDFVKHKPICNKHRNADTIPTQTDISDVMSRALKKAGFKFVGSTICYAFMQASGMVNDHVQSCFRHAECKKF